MPTLSASESYSSAFLEVLGGQRATMSTTKSGKISEAVKIPSCIFRCADLVQMGGSTSQIDSYHKSTLLIFPLLLFSRSISLNKLTFFWSKVRQRDVRLCLCLLEWFLRDWFPSCCWGTGQWASSGSARSSGCSESQYIQYQACAVCKCSRWLSILLTSISPLRVGTKAWLLGLTCSALICNCVPPCAH